MEVTKQLYKRDSKGKLRVLRISTLNGVLSQTSGLFEGKLVTHSSECKPKNVGRSNATTSEEQARLEALAKIKKKLEEGYFETVEETEQEVISPMLAKSYEKEAKKIDWANAYVQPKLDGMRCLKNHEKMISRKNKSIDTLPHIMNDITHIADYLDGELYAHGLSFQENMKLIKKARPESVNVKYHIYDMVLPNLPFSERYIIIEKMLRVGSFEYCRLVPTFKVTSMEEVKEYHSKFIEEGYEGTMIRWGDEGYKVNGRSSNLLKYKDFEDVACLVVDVVPSDRNPEQGVVECEFAGKKFRCGMKFSHEERKGILINKQHYIGQVAEIRFFEGTDDGIPRFPVCVGFRQDK